MKTMAKAAWFGGFAVCFGCAGTTPSATSADDSGSEDPSPNRRSRRSQDADTADSTPSAADVESPFGLPRRGLRGSETRTMSMSSKLILEYQGSAAGLVDQAMNLEEGRRLTVFGVGEKAITELGVYYGVRQGSGLEDWSPLPTESRAYRVTTGGVQLDDGSAPSAEEQDIVTSEYGYIGTVHPLILAIATAESGAELEMTDLAATSIVGTLPTEIRAEGLEAKLERVYDRDGRPTAELSVSVESSITEEETKFALHLAGPAHVDLQTAWIVDMELKGDVRASGFKTVGTRKTDVSGTGDIALTRRTTIL